jgi:glycerol-3-phosphate dehydrogenase
VFNHRFTSRVVNRLHKSSDGDIFVPAGTVTLLGTTSARARHPDDTAPTAGDALRLLHLGEALFPDVWNYRILRVFAGNRPLYAPKNADLAADGSAGGRAASRNFVIMDHEEDGLAGMAGIFGGKLTTYRLMAEKISDLVCAKLGIQAPCRTALEPITPDISQAAPGTAGRKTFHVFPPAGLRLAADRMGDAFPALAARLEQGDGAEILCECEMVSRAEVELAAQDADVHTLSDVRARTRLGMGTCQGTFCSLRALGALTAMGLPETRMPDPRENLRAFFRERWRGLRPALWGTQAREIELSRAVYAVTLNLDGADDER